MTDQEKRTLSEKIATLAEAQGIDSALVWEGAKTCPQGHEEPLLYKVDGNLTDLCLMCIARGPETLEEIQRHFADPAWYPEWRMGRKPRDMTNPAVLLPVVEAWRKQRPDTRSWNMQSADVNSDAVYATGTIWDVREDYWDSIERFDPDPVIALAEALCAALEAEKGESV